jgi:RND family efflux transporter MFP subunit
MRVVVPRRRLVISVATALVLVAGVAIAGGDEAIDGAAVARVERGDFKVVVMTSGELLAKRFVRITGPQNAQAAQQYQMKISSLAPEGTLVKAGDVVAELDRSGVAARLTDITTQLQKAQAQYEQAALDSTLNLSKAREEIRTLELGLEERKLAREQAVYEAPTVKRQAEIDYEKAERAFAQAKKDYVTRTDQAKAKMREVGAERDRLANQVRIVQEVMQGFTVRAPATGMLIYEKEWNGKKRAVGSQVGAWDPTVATLPDLAQMESQTYVNEIDVRKVAVGQAVRISLDSDPTKSLSGTVTEVANVGEQRTNSDAKVFEVRILISQTDTTLRPGMTTSNAIVTTSMPNALFIPIAAVSSDSGIAVVYNHDGSRTVKQEIETGPMSDDKVVVLRGLAEGDRVLVAPPPDAAQLTLVRLTRP